MNKSGLVSVVGIAERIAEENRPQVKFIQTDARECGGVRLFVHQSAGQSFVIDIPAGNLIPFLPSCNQCFSSC